MEQDNTVSRDKLIHYIQQEFYEKYLEGLKEFVRIPSLAPLYDKDWQTNGNLYRQCDHLVDFTKSLNIKNCTLKPLKDEGKSPFLLVHIDATDKDCDKSILFYGHMDKQPYGDGWETDPTDPVIKDGLLYGRGSADDGYSIFSALLAIKACQENGLKHPKIIISMEGSEEGDIDDLLYYIQTYKHLFGNPYLAICLDDVSSTNQTMVTSNSLRGYVEFDLKVQVASNNMHSGLAGGLCPNPFEILMTLLERIRDQKTQQVIPELNVEVPDYRLEECKATSEKLGLLSKALPMLDKVQPLVGESETQNLDQFITNFWKSSLSVIGIEGLPNLDSAGYAIYKELKIRCALRIPPTMPAEKAEEIVKQKILEDKGDTFGANVDLKITGRGNGINLPKLPEEIRVKFNNATKIMFEGNEPISTGGGGSIPFMEVFQSNFPDCYFLLTGACLKSSNAHSANENLDLEYCRKLTTVVALFISSL